MKPDQPRPKRTVISFNCTGHASQKTHIRYAHVAITFPADGQAVTGQLICLATCSAGRGEQPSTKKQDKTGHKASVVALPVWARQLDTTHRHSAHSTPRHQQHTVNHVSMGPRYQKGLGKKQWGRTRPKNEASSLTQNWRVHWSLKKRLVQCASATPLCVEGGAQAKSFALRIPSLAHAQPDSQSKSWGCSQRPAYCCQVNDWRLPKKTHTTAGSGHSGMPWLLLLL